MKSFWPSAAFALLLSAAAALGQSPARSTLRIGLWTLWHDKQLTASPVPGATATLRLCATCPAVPLTQPTQIQASAANAGAPSLRVFPVATVGSLDSRPASISLAGPVTLTAHGESLTLSNPVRITARNGELVLAVTLPVESYVERVVASESSPADGPESLKALAVVVRSFALHDPHAHPGYDLCDSTHCQLLHWSQPSAPRAAAHAATLSTAGETLWFHNQRATAWFHQNCGGRTASPQEAWPTRSHAAPPPTP